MEVSDGVKAENSANDDSIFDSIANTDYVLLIIIGCSSCCVCLVIVLLIFHRRKKKQPKPKDATGNLKRVISDTPVTPISPTITKKETEMEPISDHIDLNMTNTDNNEDDTIDESEGDDMYLANGTNVSPQNVGDDDELMMM